jgi:hypothetical protein
MGGLKKYGRGRKRKAKGRERGGERGGIEVLEVRKGRAISPLRTKILRTGLPPSCRL